MYRLCIIGLGNPGTKYNDTRHNIGKDWLIKISSIFFKKFNTKAKLQAEIAESHDGKILWSIPKTYMNESGATISKILKSTNLELNRIMIIHDDLDLNIGEVRLKIGGGHGGHNGLRSIISHAGQSFIRLRVGVGHPGNKVDVTNWVLGKFKPTEKDPILESFYKFNNIIELLSNNDVQNAQLKLHTE